MDGGVIKMKQCHMIHHKYYIPIHEQTRLEINGIPLIKTYVIHSAENRPVLYGFYQPHLDQFIFADSTELVNPEKEQRWLLLYLKYTQQLTKLHEVVNNCE